ncbi:MAG: RNA methyltransferase [Lentisphaeria bacterium]
MSDFLYGINPAFEAIRAGRRSMIRLYLSQGSEQNPRLKKLAQVAEKYQVPMEFVDKALLFDFCQTREHQGCVLETGPFPYTPFAELLGEKRLLLLDNIEDPHNVGAIARTAEALGWRNMLLPRRGCPLLLPSVVKAAAGACEFLQVSVNCASNQYVKIALEEGYSVVSLDGAGPIPLEDIRDKQLDKLLLVVGGENSGVSQFILNHSSHIAAIRQSGKINSLNASVAAALALYLLA